MAKECLLDDIIGELFDNTDEYHRRRFHFYKWVARFESLRRLTEQTPQGMLVKDKYKFIDELDRLQETKLIKAKIF